MQSVMEGILRSLLKNVSVKFLVYLDDIILMRREGDLERAKMVLFASSFLFNLPKCDLVPTWIIAYLGVKIDLNRETFALTKNFVSKVVREMIRVRKFRIPKRYKQRLAGLLNFAIPILRLPFQFVHLAFHHHNKLYKFVNFVHPYDMSYKTFVPLKKIWGGAPLCPSFLLGTLNHGYIRGGPGGDRHSAVRPGWMVGVKQKCQMNFNIDKCAVMHICHNNIQHNYTMAN